jgi:hypothetical protein
VIGEEVPPPTPCYFFWHVWLSIVDERTAAAARAAQNARATVTLAAHEICKIAYPDPVELQQFLERASRDWYNPDYHVYLKMYLSLAFKSGILSLGIP